MNNAVTQQVLQALEFVYNADTTAEQRREAEAVCQKIKEDAEAPAYGLHFATTSNGYNAMTRHFGLQLIEHSIRHNWTNQPGKAGKAKGAESGKSKLALEEGLELRNRVWELIFSSCEPSSAEPQYIKEKLVAILVMLIVRIWPSRHWTDLSAQMMHLYGMSPGHREMSLRVWQTLGEEMFVYDRDATATVRKHDLTNGIVGALLPHSVVGELYPNGYRLVTDASDKSFNAGSSGSGKKAVSILVEAGNEDGWLLRWVQHACEVAGQEQSAANESLVVLLIETITTYLEWVPLKALAATQLVRRLAALLGAPSEQVRLRASSALEIISKRNSGVSDERDIVLMQFTLATDQSSAAIRHMAQAYAATLPPAVEDAWTDPSDALILAKTLALTCSNIATLQWARKKLESNILDQPGPFLELLMAMAQDPRYTVAMHALNSWTAIIKHTALNKAPAVTAAFGPLTEHTTKTLFSVCQAAQVLAQAMHGSNGNVQLDRVGISEEEADSFDSLADLRAFLTGDMRSRLLGIIRGMCSIDPAGFVGWIMPSLLPVFAPSSTASVVEAAFMIVDSILSTLDDFEQQALADGDSESDPTMQSIRQAREPCYELGQHVVQYSASDVALVTRQLQTLPSFSFLLRPVAMEADQGARDLLLKVLQKCINYLKPPAAASAEEMRDLRQVARRATAALVRLATVIPDSLMLIYGDLSQMVQSRLADGTVAITVKSYLSEFQLALIAGASCTLPQQKELAQPIIQPIIITLREFLPAMQSPAGFIEFIGLHALDQAYAAQGIAGDIQLELDAARERRNRLTQILSTLQICLNRTLGISAGKHSLAGVWGDCIEDLAPALLLLVRCLHALWNPAHWQQVAWQSAQAQANMFGILEMSPAERQIIVSGTVDSATIEATKPQNPVEAEARAIHHSLAMFRDHAYRCQGRLMSLPEMFSASRMPGFANNFTGCLFADVDALAPRHWRFLLSEVARPALETVGNWPGINSSAEQRIEIVESFVPVWLSPLFEFCTQKLGAEWQTLLASDNSQEGGPRQEASASVDDDIVREKMLRDWTRAWSHVLSEILAATSVLIPEAVRIEHDLMSSARVSAVGSSTASFTTDSGAGSAAKNPLAPPANHILGMYVLRSAGVFAGSLSAALATLQFAKDTQASYRVLTALASLAPSLTLVALMPLYMPPTPAHASTVAAYTSRIHPSSLLGASGSGDPKKDIETMSRALLSWISTDLINVMMGVLQDPFLIDLQDHTLSILADVLYYSSSVSTRMPVNWMFRDSSGASESGDPGSMLRQSILRSIVQLMGTASGVSADEVEQTVVQVAAESDGKRRRALLRVALQPALAVEKSQLFGSNDGAASSASAKSKKKSAGDQALSSYSVDAPESWTNRSAGQSSSLLDNDGQFDLSSLMP
ncbi:karyopherin [Coemansia sp. Benny D115]|nr:karyopherin [Coemansia sp. Benny D115]